MYIVLLHQCVAVPQRRGNLIIAKNMYNTDMSAIERLKGAVYRAKFAFFHSTTPETASMTRRTCLENQVIINDLLQRGFVTQERLAEVAEDKELQNVYREILVLGQNGGSDAESALLTIIGYRDTNHELYAGWLQFFRRHYERTWGLKLLSPEEEDITQLPTP